MESGKVKPARLSANHRRVLSVRMRLLEDNCLQLRELLRPAGQGGAPRAALTAEQAAQLTRALEEFRAGLARIQAELGLEAERPNVRREAAALMAMMRINVEELHPHYLKGYGAVPDPLVRYLQDSLQGLEKSLKTASQILANLRDESPAGD